MHPPHSEKIIKEFDWSHLYGHPFKNFGWVEQITWIRFLQIVESWINLTIAELFLRADFMAASGEFIGTVAFLLVGLGGIQVCSFIFASTSTEKPEMMINLAISLHAPSRQRRRPTRPAYLPLRPVPRCPIFRYVYARPDIISQFSSFRDRMLQLV